MNYQINDCPFCQSDEGGVSRGWGMSPESWSNYKRQHEAGHPQANQSRQYHGDKLWNEKCPFGNPDCPKCKPTPPTKTPASTSTKRGEVQLGDYTPDWESRFDELISDHDIWGADERSIKEKGKAFIASLLAERDGEWRGELGELGELIINLGQVEEQDITVEYVLKRLSDKLASLQTKGEGK